MQQIFIWLQKLIKNFHKIATKNKRKRTYKHQTRTHTRTKHTHTQGRIQQSILGEDEFTLGGYEQFDDCLMV